MKNGSPGGRDKSKVCLDLVVVPAIGFCLLMHLSEDLTGQQISRVREELCLSCKIKLDTVAAIDRRTPVPLSDQARITVSATGQYFVVDRVEHPGNLLRYEAQAKVATPIDMRTITLPGVPLVNPAGVVVVPDRPTGRMYDVAGNTLVSRPYETVDNLQTAVFLRDGRLVLNAHSGLGARSRYALHVLRPADSIIVSFDRHDGRVLSEAQSIEQRRVLASSRDGGIWSAHITRFRIDSWDVDRLTFRSLVRDASWFVPALSVPPPARLVPPPSMIRGVYEDPQGLLWIVLRVADPKWRGYELPSNVGMGRGTDGRYVGRNRHLQNRVFDSIVEVIDPRRLTVIASRRLDAELSGFAGPGYVIEYAGQGNEAGKYHILRLNLERHRAIK